MIGRKLHNKGEEMVRSDSMRRPLYRWLREGERGGQVVYYIAGVGFWLLAKKIPYVGTRIVEIPWTLGKLKELQIKEGLEVLQVGNVILKKALSKHNVTLVDLDAEEKSQAGLEVYKADIRSVSLPESYFDVAISISTLEHIGLQEPEFADGDKVAIRIVAKALKPGGLFFFTVPFGKTITERTFRVYDRARLKFSLGDDFEVLEERFLTWEKLRWQDTPPHEAEKAGFLKNNYSMNLGICLIRARKKNRS